MNVGYGTCFGFGEGVCVCSVVLIATSCRQMCVSVSTFLVGLWFDGFLVVWFRVRFSFRFLFRKKKRTLFFCLIDTMDCFVLKFVSFLNDNGCFQGERR